MKYTSSAKANILLLSLFVLLSVGSFFYNHHLIDKMELKERYNVELWAKALKLIGSAELSLAENELSKQLQFIDELNIDETTKKNFKRKLERNFARLSDLSLSFAYDIITGANQFKIPTIQIDSVGSILQQVYVDQIDDDSEKTIVEQFKASTNEPISFEVGYGANSQTQTIYYLESAIIKLMRYFPYLQLLFFTSLLMVGYSSFSSIKKNEQSNLWVGMAKEAAHQLGTPISSLIGWIELLKEEVKESGKWVLEELNQDVYRLQRVADRFNKIGSKPDLKETNLAAVINQVISYMEKRLPTLGAEVRLRVIGDANTIIKANGQLLEWAFENITKNAIDALQGVDNAEVTYTITVQKTMAIIDIEDNGKGIEAKNHATIFKPGFSTKSRGWGLGLSLTRRIFEEYHGGKVFVLKSRQGVGTVFRIILPIDA
jgi:nitrogen-specific signal transduction histidine kinase